MGRIFLGRYETIRPLGEGGMGQVYLARQLDLGRTVVIKVMHDHIASDPLFRERFQRETLLMARFQHPYAVTLYDASLDDPRGPCIIMEYIRGIQLDTLVHRNGRLTAGRIGRLLGQLCEVLQAAHSMGIIHRDLKPANLMVIDEDTPYEKIKVMDFGLATLVSATSLKTLQDNNNEFAVGTPGYICPEQVRGLEVDHRGDLYSVGVILFELLTGKLPFSGPSSMDVMVAHATQNPPSFAEIGAGEWANPAVEAVVMSCLAKEAADRPASARELADRFRKAFEMGDQPPAMAAPVQKNGKPPEKYPDFPIPDNNKLAKDPQAVVHRLEAWMPEVIALHKLHGFVEDMEGEVLEYEPGRYRIRLNAIARRSRGNGALGWVGIGRKPMTLELEVTLGLAGLGKHLQITVALRPAKKVEKVGADWQALFTRVVSDLRSHLMAKPAEASA
jgi:serine/threonine-protein kinase